MIVVLAELCVFCHAEHFNNWFTRFVMLTTGHQKQNEKLAEKGYGSGGQMLEKGE